MAKIFIKKEKDSVTISNLPMPGSKNIELTAEDSEKVYSGKYNFDLKGSKLEFTEIPEKPKVSAKKELKEKLNNGTATDEDIKEALKLLL